MEIIRKSKNFAELVKHFFDADVDVIPGEPVVVGYRQEQGTDAFGREATIEIPEMGEGAPSYRFDWPDEAGAPPSEQEIDEWSKPLPPPELTIEQAVDEFLLRREDAELRLLRFAAHVSKAVGVDAMYEVLFSDEARRFEASGGAEKYADALIALASKFDQNARDYL